MILKLGKTLMQKTTRESLYVCVIVTLTDMVVKSC